MALEDDFFRKYTPDFNKLVKYGFKQEKSKYLFEKLFRRNEFKAVIEISKSGKIKGKVFDIENQDEFLPLRYFPQETQEGAFVGEIREEYNKILTDIRKKCFSEKYFVSPQSNRITRAVIEKYGNEPVFMWEQTPGCGVFKNPDNNKWYGIIMDVDRTKIGEKNKIFVELLNIKLDKDEIQELLKTKGFYPAYHMNKKSWITIALDETVPDEKILELISESYSYTIQTKKKKV